MRGGVGAGGRKEKPHNPLMISVQKVRIRPGKGKGQSDGWFPQPLTHNTRRVCTDDPENKLPMHSLCPTREWEREWYGVTTPNIVPGQGVILFPFGATPPLIGEAEEVVAAEPVCARVGRWRVGHAPPPPKPRCCSTPGHYTLHCHGRASDGA